ncbi:g1113 [Coccomyxa viridis]|uniref:G1113 protein n=1 Tax=Coccomyxa viridis TaxID=1274662 RepID=A0ABP1FHA1_9CHLO
MLVTGTERDEAQLPSGLYLLAPIAPELTQVPPGKPVVLTTARARWDPTKVNDVTYTGELIPPQAPAQVAPIKITVLGSWWAALLLVCTTMMCLTSAFTAFILYVRPVLQRTERAALACEIAAQGMEEACEELEKASEVIHTDLPTTLNAMERTSLEFEELGRSLNMLSGPIKRAAVPALAVRAVSNNTGDGMRKIANDVTSLTQALTPAMEGWRKRIGRIAANFEAANKVPQQPIAPGPAQPQAQAGSNAAQAPQQRAEKASKESKGKKRGEAFSGPHSVWDSLTELGGDAAAAKGDRQIAQALTQAIQQEGCGSQEEVAAALATQEMADAASGVMAEASRLASDIISAESAASEASALNGRNTQSPAHGPEQSAEMLKRRESAEAVFAALFKAQEAASAAAKASGELETALKRAESQSWSDSTGVDSAVSKALEGDSRTVKISKQGQAAGSRQK